jgi:hypothetical protein
VIRTGPAILSFFSNGEVMLGYPCLAGVTAATRIASNPRTEHIARKPPVD